MSKITVGRTVTADVLIVGGGGAGLRAALSAHTAGAKAVVAVKGRLGQAGATVSQNSQSVAWQMADECGSAQDDPDSHVRNILDVGLGMTDPRLAKIVAYEIGARSHELEGWGMEFIPDPDGSDRHYAGYSCFGDFPRAHGISNSGYGHAGDVVRVLSERLSLAGVPVHEDVYVTDLLVEHGACVGAVALDPDGEVLAYRTGAVILATGGSWQMHPPEPGKTTIDTTGDGYGMGLRAGAVLANMEFMQYMLHRVGTIGVQAPGVIWALIPELKNSLGEEALTRYLPAGITPEQVMRERTEHYPFSTRDHSKWLDIAIGSEVQAGRGHEDGSLDLDFSHFDAGNFAPSRPQHIPQDFARPPQVAPPYGRVRISAHAINGGLLIDERTQTSLPGLFAVGETAAGPHGADRLGGGMVSAGQVFGERAGRYSAEHAQAARAGHAAESSVQVALARLQSYGKGSDKASATAEAVIGELQAATARHMLVVRNETDLTRLVAKIEELRRDRLPKVAVTGPLSLRRAVETENLLTAADLMARAALARRESRGGHYREDYPTRDDDNWRSSIILRLSEGSVLEERQSLEER